MKLEPAAVSSADGDLSQPASGAFNGLNARREKLRLGGSLVAAVPQASSNCG
jgi:hypothetical protein